MSKQLIGMFDPFDENGDFDAEKIVDHIQETVKKETSVSNNE